jgi:hypothetical protein
MGEVHDLEYAEYHRQAYGHERIVQADDQAVDEKV